MDWADTRVDSDGLVVAVTEAEAETLAAETTEALLLELTDVPGLEIAALWVTDTAPA